MRFLIATAVSVPLVFGSIQGTRLFAEYRQSNWYAEMANWFTRQAEEARRNAERHVQEAESGTAGPKSAAWQAKAQEQLALSERYESQASLCRSRAKEWGPGWFNWMPPLNPVAERKAPTLSLRD